MATLIYFITPTEIKATAYIDENVDDKYLVNAIAIAQELYILPLLGTGLYEELKTQIDANTLTSDNDKLLSTYLQPALKYWALYESIEPLTYKFTNKGILKKSGENSETIDFNDITKLKDKFRNIAEWHSNRIKLFLIEYATTYPLYLSPGTGADIIHPQKQAFDCGWFLGNIENCSNIDKRENPGTCCD